MRQVTGYIRRSLPGEGGEWTEVRLGEYGGVVRHVYDDDELAAALARALEVFGSATIDGRPDRGLPKP